MNKNNSIIKGKVYVLGDNIDTDLIIPAVYLNLVPTIPEEYKKLGSYALAGLPDTYEKFVPEGTEQSPYSIVVAGRNFGCGSSREHAPVALGAAGVKAVLAKSYARIFFRNCMATGEVYPLETETRICDLFKTGDDLEINLASREIIGGNGARYSIKDPGELIPVISAGGIFGYARQTGMISKSSTD